jgi:predicted HicB family RNase H-like nuclease
MGKHDKTLAAVFADPVRANLRWADIEALFKHVGGILENREGSPDPRHFNGRRCEFSSTASQPENQEGGRQGGAPISRRSRGHAMTGHFFTEIFKGYLGRAEYDPDDDSFDGEILGIRDVITFSSKTPKGLQKAFEESVDDYLAWCKSRGKEPNKPFSGNFLVRATPDLHRGLNSRAAAEGKSLNAFVVEHLQTLVSIPKRKRRRQAV